MLLLVDVQKDFCFPQGSLFVAGRSGRGALDDNRRLATFLYRNLDRVTATVSTLDSHLPHHIFSPSFWIGRDGEPLAAHRIAGRGGYRERGSAAAARARLLGRRRRLRLAAAPGPPLLRTARAARSLPALPVAAALPDRQSRAHHGRRGPGSEALPCLRAQRGGVDRDQGHERAHRALLGAGSRDHDGPRRHAAGRGGVGSGGEVDGRRSAGDRGTGIEPLRQEHDRGSGALDRGARSSAGAPGLCARGLHVGGGGAGSRAPRAVRSRTSPSRRGRRSTGAEKSGCAWCDRPFR